MISDDPSINYLANANVATGALFPEEVFRALISAHLDNVRRDIDLPRFNIIDRLFVRLSQKTRDQIRSYFRQNKQIACVANWPVKTTSIPFIAVVNASENESRGEDGQPVLGDYGGSSFNKRTFIPSSPTAPPQNPGNNEIATETGSIPESYVTNIFVSTFDPNFTMVLHWIVKFFLFVHKLDLLRKFDINNLTLGGQDLRWTPEYYPELCYTKVVQVKYCSHFTWELEYEAIAAVRLTLF